MTHSERTAAAIPEHPAKVLVAIVHWNRPEWCASAVTHVHRSSTPVDVLVVDNRSPRTDALAAMLPARTELLRMPTNGGYTAGANAALRAGLSGGYDFVAVCAHDALLSPHALSEMLEVAAQQPDAGVIGPVLSSKVAGSNTLGRPTNARSLSVPWVSGACMLLRRQAILDIGPFDERLGSYSEDVDYSRRALRAGWDVRLATRASAATIGRASQAAHDAHRSNNVRVAVRFDGRRAGLVELVRLTRLVASSAASVPRDRAAALTTTRRCATLTASVIRGVLHVARGPSPAPTWTSVDLSQARRHGEVAQ